MKNRLLLAMVLSSGTIFAQCFSTGTGADGGYVASSNTTLAGGTYNYSSFTIDPGVTVTVTGTAPLVVRCTGAVTINGILTASGGNGSDGLTYVSGGFGGTAVAGGGNGGDGSFAVSAGPIPGTAGGNTGGVGNAGDNWSGGGGAGYAANGGASGNPSGGLAGTSYGSADLSGLWSGSGGGGGSGGYNCGSGGGGAGGGLIVFNASSIVINAGGAIVSNGGNGGSDGVGNCGGGGGGSGGTIWIAAFSVTNHGSISAAGGAGGASNVGGNPYYGTGGNGSVGRIRVDSNTPMVGSGSVTPVVGFTSSSLSELFVAEGTVVATCGSATDGSASVVPSGGNGSYTFFWSNGSTANPITNLAAGTYNCTVTDLAGCTKVIDVIVPSFSASSFSQTLSVCAGESITVGGNTYTTSGTYQDVLVNAVGCDSTVTTNLTVASALSSSQTVSVCSGESVTIGASTFSTSGTHQVILTSPTTGCDSVVTLNLTVLPALSSSQTLSICAGESVTLGASTFSTTGTHQVVFTSAVSGCDSTVTLNLTVAAPINVGVTVNQGVMQVAQSGATYQWLDCDNNMTPISLATNQNYTPTVNGIYAVEVTMNGCSDTSDCENYNLIGLAEKPTTDVSLYPNPTTGLFTILLNGTAVNRVSVVDATGRIVLVIDEISDNEMNVDLKHEQPGLYFVQLQVGNDLQTLRIVKE